MTTREELREAIKDTLRLYGIQGEKLGSLRPGSVADALITGALAALIADAERVQRVREETAWLETANWREGVTAHLATTITIRRLRRALGEEPQP